MRVLGSDFVGPSTWLDPRITCFVMPALVAGIHVLAVQRKTWMAGSSPAMTMEKHQN
jgi:hypothetical protein